MSIVAVSEPAASRRKPVARKVARVVQPTTNERFFEKDDIIVSKTNLKGHLTYVNRVFMAISDYQESELLGQPHSMIRHPDMPRAIFKLLWDQLQAGKEIFAYVKNMTKTGDFYWVLAHATPSIAASGETIGYHSSRRVPDRRVVDGTIIPLYRALKDIEDGEADRRAGLVKSSERLNAILKEKGIGYDEFIFGL
ncbi:MAG: PAS domain-containing protein [Parvibaculum sp.]|uniref:PAS domain-containing protein n=1 Tax=Parvibaculum sp. TaxID=2024848 RepID=UPI002717C8BF|nr:PAS domain-containing protein [Parvibaculum sp.]MDO8838573.1 PAS domain-containing protein [Parvibaculum sp.]